MKIPVATLGISLSLIMSQILFSGKTSQISTNVKDVLSADQNSIGVTESLLHELCESLEISQTDCKDPASRAAQLYFRNVSPLKTEPMTELD